MGYLLKEALKTLCGVNQWSYAVFWKIGCQNPKLLIWEDCYYEPASCSGLAGNENQNAGFQDFNASWLSAEASNLQPNFQAGGKVHLLVNKMMMDNHVNIVGEGLVGRVAFTGNHQWILSETFFAEAHPPEVLKELCKQFSAGMQTIAVIPVLPHGVVQFGSFMPIMENRGFINDVTSLIHQLGHVSGVLLSSANYEVKEEAPRIGVPVGNILRGGSSLESNAPCSFDSFNYVGGNSSCQNTRQTSFSLAGEIINGLQSNSTAIETQQGAKVNQLMNGVAKAVVIPSNSELWKKQHSSNIRSTEQRFLPNSGNHNVSSGILIPTLGMYNGGMSNMNPPLSGVGAVSDANWVAIENITSEHSKSDSLLTHKYGGSVCKKGMGKNVVQGHDIPLSQYSEHLNMADLVPGFVQDYQKQKVHEEAACVQPEYGDDLFDVLGADFKKKLFSSWNNEATPVWDRNNVASKKNIASSEEMYSTSQGNSESGIFSSDHLLEAIVSKIPSSTKPTMDDTVSCKTTLSSSSAPNSSLPYGRFGVSNSDHIKGELLGVPKYLAKGGAMSSCSLRTGSSKEESGTYSQGSSIYGSQISSWIEKEQRAKPDNSVSTGHSKKADETGKTNRKRLKPGENPRPRPKDRQMIQDRVKELREIVPNGAKCSIDALLERTIKHMLFLQSVTKHADKLKQTGDSKIISKDGGLLLKDNFEGGATWAYEVGSQSMVCPIIVEDLNQPRQMLVEMLCEERGLFLEIADIIRGLGLTILKGVMETRDDKIWARFAVEANRDVTRMEIFISLVRLLEQSSKTAIPNGISSDNLMMAQQFHPVTARSRSLQ
ncbi:hypothetical protein ACS0TY_020585 [Phlomoides rotata]